MENLTEARCAVEGCGHLKAQHYSDDEISLCFHCPDSIKLHVFVLAHAHVKQEKAEREE